MGTDFIISSFPVLKAFPILQSSSTLGSRRLGLANGMIFLLRKMLAPNPVLFSLTCTCINKDKRPNCGLEMFDLSVVGCATDGW